ncbi:ATPase [Micromonospora sp. NPDC051141]|uniref:ATPase n=1 Tax=Micromonospora sp. NPDC051141 TaxID=3364284 RepID=UPI003787CD60
MRFSVVEAGYDRRQVDACLDELDLRLRRLAARAEGVAGTGREWDRIRLDAGHLCDYLRRRAAPADPSDADVPAGPSTAEREAAEREAADLVARARAELDAAREEARLVREEAYAEALRARREFEAALLARRRREARVDEILSGARVPADTPTAAAGR